MESHRACRLPLHAAPLSSWSRGLPRLPFPWRPGISGACSTASPSSRARPRGAPPRATSSGPRSLPPPTSPASPEAPRAARRPLQARGRCPPPNPPAPPPSCTSPTTTPRQRRKIMHWSAPRPRPRPCPCRRKMPRTPRGRRRPSELVRPPPSQLNLLPSRRTGPNPRPLLLSPRLCPNRRPLCPQRRLGRRGGGCGNGRFQPRPSLEHSGIELISIQLKFKIMHVRFTVSV